MLFILVWSRDKADLVFCVDKETKAGVDVTDEKEAPQLDALSTWGAHFCQDKLRVVEVKGVGLLTMS